MQVPAATSFPQVIGLGATFNSYDTILETSSKHELRSPYRSLFRLMATAISTEGRAMYNVGRSGLTFFAPNVNIYRYCHCSHCFISVCTKMHGSSTIETAFFSLRFVLIRATKLSQA